MTRLSLVLELSFFSTGGFSELEIFLGKLEEFDRETGGRISLTATVPDDIMYHQEWRDYFTPIESRYSRFINMLPSKGQPDVTILSRGGHAVDLFGVGLVRRSFAHDFQCIALARCSTAPSPEEYIQLKWGDLILRLPSITPPFDLKMFNNALACWKAHELAKSLCLLLIGGGSAERSALELSVEFGFDDCATISADGPPSKQWRKRAETKTKNPKNLCIATSKVGHAHTQGLSVRFAGCSTHDRLADVIFDELLKLANE